MTRRQAPLKLVNERYGSKNELIDTLAKKLEPAEGESADEFKQRLKGVPNRKLLRLASISEQAEALGGRAEIIGKIAELRGQPKDHEYKDALGDYSLGELVDLHDSLQHRAQGKAKKAVPRRQRRRRNRFR